MFEANTDFHELARRLHSGDPDAYEFVIRSFAKRIIAHLTSLGVSRQDAEEIWGDCLLKLWDTHCKSYDPNRSSFLTWLLKVARNLAIDRLKANQNRCGVPQVEAEGLEDSNTIEAKYSGKWDLELVDRAKRSLRKNDQTVINLKYGHDLTYAEMSRILGKSPAAVGMHVRRAVKRLRTQVERLNDDYQRRRQRRTRSPDSS